MHFRLAVSRLAVAVDDQVPEPAELSDFWKHFENISLMLIWFEKCINQGLKRDISERLLI